MRGRSRRRNEGPGGDPAASTPGAGIGADHLGRASSQVIPPPLSACKPQGRSGSSFMITGLIAFVNWGEEKLLAVYLSGAGYKHRKIFSPIS